MTMHHPDEEGTLAEAGLLVRRSSQPIPARWHLPRQQLCGVIEGMLSTSRIVVIHAPSGYGKTSVVAQFASRHADPVSWLTFESSDRDASNLVASLVRCLSLESSTAERMDRSTVDARATQSSSPGVAAIVELANKLSWSRRFQTIILDNFEVVVGEAPALRQIQHLVRFTPDHVRFILITQQWSSSMLIDSIDQEPAVISAQDLLFTVREVEDGLAETSLPWPWWKAAQRMHSEFFGWPSAIGVALRSDPNTYTNLDSLIEDVNVLGLEMVGDVMSRLSAGEAEIVMVASCLRYFDASILSQCIQRPYTSVVFESMVRFGIICRTRREGPYYSICQVFRHVMRLNGRGSGLDMEQHATMANWYEVIGDMRSCLKHRTEMGDGSATVGYLRELKDGLESPDECREYIDAFDRYDTETTEVPDQELVWTRGHAALRLGLVGENADYLAHIIQRAHRHGDSATVFRIARANALRNQGAHDASYAEAQLCLKDDDLDDVSHTKILRLLGTLMATALALEEADDYFERAINKVGEENRLKCNLLADLAQYRWMQGRLEDCKAICDEVLQSADSQLYYQAMAIARNGLGIYWQTKGEYGLAESCLGDALTILRRPVYRAIEALLWLSLADLSFDQNDLDEAERRYRRALAISTVVDQPSYVSYALSGLAGVERVRGHFAEAGKMLAEARGCMGPEQRYDIAVCSLRKAHLLMDENKLGLALQELEGTITALRDGGALIDLSRGLLLRANTLFLGYGQEAAYADLTELMSCIQTIGTSQFLAPYCRRMPRLLRALGASPQLKAYASIMSVGADVPGGHANGKVTPIAAVDDPHPDLLSERELEVVQGLCEGLTRTELAARVGLSRSTVDKLIHAIYTATGFEATHQIVAWAYRTGLYRPRER